MTLPATSELVQLYDHMVDAVYLIDPETSNIIWCNRAGYEELGFQKDELLNHSVLSLQKDVTGLPQWQEVAEVVRKSDYFTFVGRHLHKKGGEIAVEVNTTHFTINDHSYFLSIARNINRRLALEKDLSTRNDRIWFALNEASDGMWEWEVATGYVYFSPQLKQMLGYGPDEMEPIVDTWAKNIHPEDLERVTQILQDHLADKRRNYEAEYRLRNRNGHYIWVHDRGQVCQRNEDGEPTHVVGMVQNITERKKLQFQLEELAANDVLTKLPNRREGQAQAEQQLAIAHRIQQPLSIAVVDFDHFKQINDLYGHQKGDEALIFGAQLFKQTLRSSDLIYRWGGEEFVIILPATDQQQAEKVTSILHRAFAQANWEPLGIEPVTLSLGVATYPNDGDDFNSLLKEADMAVYRAKEKGRNQTVFAAKTTS